MSPMNNRLMRPRSGGGATDADARAYVQAVQTADGQALEPAVVKAIDDFVIGCKADGIWTAIGSACILMGARTLNGIMTPLKGTAPSPNAFVGDATDYNRKTGLLGNASTKYIDSNRAPTSDDLNSNHIAVYVSVAGTPNSSYPLYIGNTSLQFGQWIDTSQLYFRNNALTTSTRTPGTATGLIGCARNDSANFVTRVNGSSTSPSPAVTSSARGTGDYAVFGIISAGQSSGRIAFYSIGSFLDLALLDTRVSALYTAIGATSI